MDKFMNWMDVHVTPLASKLGSNAYLKAISGGFVAVMSATIVGSIFTLLGNLPITAWTNFISSTGLNAILALPGQVTTDIIAMYFVFFCAYNLARTFGVDGGGAGLACLVSFMLVTGRDETGAISTGFLGSRGLFTAIIIALLGARLFIYVVKKGWVIKLPDSVPPNVSASFSALIPTGVVVLVWLIVAGIMRGTSFGTLHNLIFTVIQQNLMRFVGNNVGAYVFFQLMCNLLWFFGLHGGNITGSITNPIYTPLSLENFAAYQAGATEMPYIITGAFSKSYMSGGVGSMFGMAIVMCLFCKSQQMKILGRLSLPTTMFFINEPLLFGIPVVLNPLFFLPLMLFTPIMGIITYFLMKVGIVPTPIGAQIPWTMPPVLNGLIQGGHRPIAMAIYEALTVVASGLVWYPFVMIADRQALREEQGLENAD
ncbi:MAG: PTS sugar transporter subunit IIC [Solobacterium sp.]|nr:PTS sugar transporter subunit IIC [Solobacterium sp.]